MQTITQAADLDIEEPGRAAWVQLETRNDWELVRPLGGVLIIADADGTRYHGRGCVLAGLGPFESGVVDRRAAGEEPAAEYYWAARPRSAEAGGAGRCEHVGDPLCG
jgi:hypothetical protein